MEINLSVKLLMHLISEQSDAAGETVKLSSYRHAYNIPKATFYRHVDTLISEGFIERYGRDRYGISDNFGNRVKTIPTTKVLAF